MAISREPSGNRAVALAYEEQIEPERDAMINETLPSLENESLEKTEVAPAEKTHNLVVVPSPSATEEPAPEVILKPKRLIRDDHDPALNYLDSIPTTVVVDSSAYRSAPVLFRLVAGVMDLAIIGLLAFALIAIAGFTTFEWTDLRLIGAAGGAE